MKTGLPILRGDRTWFVRVASISLLALLPLALLAQGPAQQSSQANRPQATAQSNPNWADEILNKEGYVSPPAELASAVLAPRQLNVTLSTLSPDKKFFLTRSATARRPF